MPRKPNPPARGPEGCVVRAAKNGKTKIVRSSGGRWTLQAEKLFLENLAATANVKAASEAAGFSPGTAYNQRMANPGFAARWQEALETGVARLEMLLVHSAGATLEGLPLDGDHPIPRMTIDDVMNVLKLHRAQTRGGPTQRYAWRMELPPIEQVQAEILRKVAALRKGRGLVAFEPNFTENS